MENIINEIWRPIKGYEGLYEVSNLGRIKSVDRTVVYKNGRTYIYKGQILLISKCTKGYFRVELSKDNKRKYKYGHRLVAEAFIPNPDNKPCVDHINTDRSDNRVENLRWVTYTENNLNPLTVAKRSIPIVQLTKDGTAIALYKSVRDTSEQTGISNTNISRCCTGERKTAGGFRWMSFEDYEQYY